MRLSKLASILIACLLLPLFGSGAGAQELARLYTISPRDGHDLAAAIGEHARWRQENGDPWTWGVYEVVAGSELGSFVIRSGGHSWADFDAYEASEFSAAADAHYAATMAPAVGSIEGIITVGDTAHRRLPDSLEGIELYEVITWHLKPDRVQDFWGSIDRIHDAIVQTDWPVRYAFVTPSVGSEGPQASLVLFREDWAAFESPEQTFEEMMGEVYGEEAGEVMERLSGAVRWQESFVLRIRPDLSVNLGG